MVATEASHKVELQGRPGTSRQLSQQAAVEAEEGPEPLREGEDDLSTGDLLEQLSTRSLGPLQLAL